MAGVDVPEDRGQPREELCRGPSRSAGHDEHGVGLGIALWFITTHLTGGDDFFHLARVRKLESFDLTSLSVVNEFRDGGLHPGYE